MTERLIVDTDTAGDDVTSLLIALLHPNAQLEAITICNGNVEFAQQVENALYTVEQAGKGIPVYPGCPKPLVADWVDAAYVHGEDGMGDSFFPKATQRPEPEHAIDELVRRINEAPGALNVLAQAPLTNIAAAVTRDPSIAQKVKRLWIMGGGVGNITPAAQPQRPASRSVRPSASATANAAVKASPAPVVSTALAGNAGTRSSPICAPCSPSVRTNVPCAPLTAAASVSLGVT